jgi:hypothetical protein
MPQRIGALSRQKHGGDCPGIQRPNIEIQTVTARLDIFHFSGIIGHDRRTAAGKHHIGAVIHGHIIGDAMYQRNPYSDLFQHFL